MPGHSQTPKSSPNCTITCRNKSDCYLSQMNDGLPFLVLIDAVMVGVILSVQLVVYPGFARYAPADLLKWHEDYSRKITFLVGPLMLCQLAGAWYWLLTDPGWFPAIYLAGILILWGTTFFRFVPLHRRISQGRADQKTLLRLVRENWTRTFLWILVLFCHLLAQ